MDLVPLKKSNLTRAQFEQLSDVPPEDDCIRDLGHIRSFRCVLQDTYVYSTPWSGITSRSTASTSSIGSSSAGAGAP